MINVTDSIKKAYEESTTQYDKIILDGQEYDINNVQYEDDCYLDGNVFGTAIARTLDFEIENIVDLENKEFKYLTGIKTENGIEWIDLGTFITQEVDPNDTTGITKVTAMDYMLKSNIEYVSNLNYASGTVTILQVLQEACQKAGITLATTDFANAGFIVDSNQFTEGSLIRQVFQAVAQISGTFAKVRYDDKLYFITPKTTGLKVKDVHKMLVKDLNLLPVSKLAGCEFKMKMNDYSELILKRNTHPINLVSLGMSDVEGENVVKRDEESIAEDGENSLVINDNPFAYTEEKRKQLITALFDTVKGFEYTSFEITGQAKPYQETGDEVVVVDKDGTFSYSFLFRFNYKSPNGLESEMSAPSLTKATVNYQNIASSEEQAIKRTELIVDKQNQTITGLITKTDKNTEKLSKHEQTLDSITDTLSSVETTVEGTVKTVQVQYALSDSSTVAPESGWSNVAPEWQEGKYMWQKTVTIFMNDMQIESEPTCIQGANGKDGTNGTNGKDGTDGKDGLGIEKLETQYYLSTSNKTCTGGSWKSTQDKWTPEHYIWTRTKITWSDNSVTYSEPILAEGLNTANENANSANEGTKVVTTKMSEVEKTVESVTTTVTETTERLNNDYSTTEQTQSMIKSESDNITSSVNKTIDNIQVGGTNLIPNSAPYNLEKYYINNSSNIELTLQDEETAPFGKCLRLRTLKQLDSSSSWGIYILPTTKVLEGNKEYCFSLWMRATANTQMTVGYVRGGQTKFNVTTNWQKFTYKFIALTPTGDSHGFWISFPSGTILGRQIFVHSMKLEEGNKITAWSPAPSDDVKGYEFGTKIEQNWEHVKYAWNQISQAIQLEGDNGNATMAFLDNNKKFAEMGVNTVDNDRYISFAVPVNYGQDIQDGMAWGMQTPDGKFWPILYVKNFHMANQNAGDFSGELVLQACNLALEGINSAITCGNVNLTTADALGGIIFEDATTHKNIFTVMPQTDAYGYAHLEILDKISFFRNQAGSETLRVGDTSGGTNCTITTDGYLGGEELYIGSRGISCVGNISAHSHIYCNNGVEPFSLAEKKRDIEKYNNKALDEVLNTDIYYYNYKEDAENIKRRVGAIIGDKYKCSKEIIGTEGKGIDLYSMISVAYKAIQEQQEIIEKQNNTIEELTARVEKLEKAGEA